jgi:hypothetical protein
MKDQTLATRVFGTIALCSNVIELAGERFTPDASKAYAEFTLARGFPVITAYGTCLHPGTVANSFASMKHQVLDYDHRIKAYNPRKNDGSKEDEGRIARDHIIGTIVAVDFPRAPLGGWKVGFDKETAPAIHGVAVIHKQAEKVPQILGEHLGGRHKWSVSLEMEHQFLQGGFVVGDRAKAKPAQQSLMAADTPPELAAGGFGYVTVENAPAALLDCFDLGKRRVVGAWQGLPVSFMQGGLNGDVHFMGAGIVRYGAEREAEIQQILAHDPDRLDALTEEELFGSAAIGYLQHCRSSFATLGEILAAGLAKK